MTSACRSVVPDNLSIFNTNSNPVGGKMAQLCVEVAWRVIVVISSYADGIPVLLPSDQRPAIKTQALDSWKNLGKDGVKLKPVSTDSAAKCISPSVKKAASTEAESPLNSSDWLGGCRGDRGAPPMTPPASPNSAPESSSRPFLHISHISPGRSLP